MKKILSLLFLVFAGYSSYAQTVNVQYLNPAMGNDTNIYVLHSYRSLGRFYE